MRAERIRGEHPDWKGYLNGPGDYEALRRVRGIGHARAALLLRLYGSVDGFLQADPLDVAERSRSLIGPRLAHTLQARSRDAGLRSDWSQLRSRAGNDLEEGTTQPPAKASGGGRHWLDRARGWWAPGHARLDKVWAAR